MKIFRRLMLLAILGVATSSVATDTPPPATTANAEAPAKPAQPAPAPVKSPAAAKREACIQSCAAVEVECSSSARNAKQQCMKSAATGGVDPMTMRRDLGGYFCGYFRGNHCGGANNPQQCAERYVARYALCGDYYRDNMAKQYFDCGDGETKSLGMCRDELLDCQAACGE